MDYLISYAKIGLVTGIVIVVIAFLLKSKIKTNKISESPISAVLLIVLI